MARTLSAYSQARIAEDGTRPIYAVNLGFDTGGGTPWRITSFDQNITLSGVTYTKHGVKVSGFDHNATTVTPTVTVDNTDGAVLALIQSEGLGTQEAVIHKMWGVMDATSPYTTSFVTGDFETIFRGIISGAPRIGSEVVLTLKHDFQTRMVPFIRLGKPVNNWNAQVGATFYWFNGKITVV